MISREVVEKVDQILDEKVSLPYKKQPLAQDWARVSKIGEELGESINELIILSGQNPRKPQNDAAYERLLKELADTAMTGVYAIQHFTKDIDVTQNYILDAQSKHLRRLQNGS